MEEQLLQAVLDYGIGGLILLVVGWVAQRVGLAALERLFGQLEAQRTEMRQQEAKHDAALSGFQQIVTANTAAMGQIGQEVSSLKLNAGKHQQQAATRHTEVIARFNTQDHVINSEHEATMQELRRIAALIEQQQQASIAEYKAAEARFKQEMEGNKLILAQLRIVSLQLDHRILALPAPKNEEKAA